MSKHCISIEYGKGDLAYHVVFEARFEDWLLGVVDVRLAGDELGEELSEEGVEVNAGHVEDARRDLLSQEGVTVVDQHLEQHAQELDYQVLREHRLLVKLPPAKRSMCKCNRVFPNRQTYSIHF